MGKQNKYWLDGVKYRSQELADKFGIKRSVLNKRIREGWKLKNGEMIAPARKATEKRFDTEVSRLEYIRLKNSFIGDCADDSIEW